MLVLFLSRSRDIQHLYGQVKVHIPNAYSVYVCRYLCMYVCKCVFVYVCMYVCMHVYMYVYMLLNQYVCM